VALRGQLDEDSVLCTQSKTYAIKFVGNSNSPFLIPPSGQFALCENSQDFDGEINDFAPVIKVAPGNMELVEVAPKLDRLKLLLSENPYSYEDVLEMDFMEDVEKNKARLYNWDDLVERVQASDEELRNGLCALSAVEIDGFWRIVDEKYMDMILRMLLHNSILNDWSLDALNEDDVVSVLVSDGFPDKLACHCLHVYGSKVDGDVGRSCVWRLDESRVCVHFARQILSTGKKKMETFMAEWLQRIPGRMQASFNMLEGEVLTEKLGVETWVYSFSVSSLPLTPAERFNMLFRERSKWEWKDLQPYIRFDPISFFSLDLTFDAIQFPLMKFIFQRSKSTWPFVRRFAAQVHSKNTTNLRCRSCFQFKIVHKFISVRHYPCNLSVSFYVVQDVHVLFVDALLCQSVACRLCKGKHKCFCIIC
jgi:sister chromatid cohesion protein DCC1